MWQTWQSGFLELEMSDLVIPLVEDAASSLSCLGAFEFKECDCGSPAEGSSWLDNRLVPEMCGEWERLFRRFCDVLAVEAASAGGDLALE